MRFRNVFREFLAYLENDTRKKAVRVRDVVNRDLFCGVFADGEGHGYVEASSLHGLPNYAYDYAMEFTKKYNGIEKEVI